MSSPSSPLAGRRRLVRQVAAGLALTAFWAAGCGSSAGHRAAAADGPVDVLYAGSLAGLMENRIGPAFHAATGDTFDGFGAGSQAVANQIKGGVRVGDVFISASATADTSLEGAANGGWVQWYATVFRAPLVIGYNPHSRFAAAFRDTPWYQVLGEPGVRVGRTDPKLDPKGTLTLLTLQRAQSTYRLPGFADRVAAVAPVFPEEQLVGRLQAGQLDAAFLYANEAALLHIPAVSLGSVAASATFTVTLLARAPHPAGAVAFLRYLLGPAGRAAAQSAGLTLLPPTLVGPVSAVPAALASLLSR